MKEMYFEIVFEFDPSASLKNPFWAKLYSVAENGDRKLLCCKQGECYEAAREYAAEECRRLYELSKIPVPARERIDLPK